LASHATSVSANMAIYVSANSLFRRLAPPSAVCQPQGPAPLRRLGQHLRRQRPGRRGRGGCRVQCRRPRRRVPGGVTPYAPSCARMAPGMPHCATPRASRSACAHSSPAAASGPSLPTSRTWAGCDSCPASPSSA